jgi:hypothetical protein
MTAVAATFVVTGLQARSHAPLPIVASNTRKRRVMKQASVVSDASTPFALGGTIVSPAEWNCNGRDGESQSPVVQLNRVSSTLGAKR